MKEYTRDWKAVKSACSDLASEWKKYCRNKDNTHQAIRDFLKSPHAGVEFMPINTPDKLEAFIAALDLVASEHGGFSGRMLGYAMSIIAIALGIVFGFNVENEQGVVLVLRIIIDLVLLAVLLFGVSLVVEFKCYRKERALLASIRVAQLKGELTLHESSEEEVLEDSLQFKMQSETALIRGRSRMWFLGFVSQDV